MNERFTQAPHHNDPKHAQSPNAALLIDFDNVTMGIRSNLGQELRQLMSSDIIRGKVSVQRAYADWRRYPQYVVPLSEAAIDLIYAPAYGSSKKNATDIRLAIDALELVFTRPEIGTFILLSGDSDFSSLVLKLKEYGKYVIGVGMQESSSDLLVQNCDEYYSYDSLSGLVSADDMDTDRHDPWELAEHSIRKMVERDDVMRSDRLKQVMLELDPSFDEKEIGYSKFNRFLTEASSRGILQLQKIGNGQYKVGPGSSVDVEAPSGDGGSGGSGASASSGGESPPPPRDLSEQTDGGGTATQEAPEQKQSTSSGGGRSGREQKSGRQGQESGRKQQERKQDEQDGGGRSAARKRAGGDRPVVEAEQLREAYDLLQDVVSDLSDEDGRVRDSEVKREMLNRDSSFDEGALGFSKFSRFIRQAHDEEVVDIEKDSDGNYYLSVGGDAAPAAGGQQQDRQQQDRREQDRKQPAREAQQRQPREEQTEPEPEPEPEPAAESRTESAADGERDAEERESDGGEPAAAESSKQKQEEKEKKEQDRARRGGGLRRRRKKDDGGTSRDSDDDSWVPGPVDAGGGDGDDDSGPTTQPAGSGAGSEESGSKERRTLGRFRRGSKSGKGKKEEEDDSGGGATPGPVSTSSPEGDAERNGDAGSGGSPADGTDAPTEGAAAVSGPSGSGDASEDSSGGRSEPAGELDEIVAHMKDHYSGVGEKTARKLVDEFGEETLSVIDENPRRVEQLLPKHRAEAVLQARAVERQEGGRD